LGKIGTAAAVPPLQTLLRRSDARVLQAAVSALAGIPDPAAERSLHTVLKASSGDARTAVIAALVNLKDTRVVPMLVRILQDSDPFGGDAQLVLDTLVALAMLSDDRAVPQIAVLTRQRRWLSWGKTTRLRRTGLQALKTIGSAKAQQALADLAATGDFFLRRQAARLA
jgi:HEAT repeat protein